MNIEGSFSVNHTFPVLKVYKIMFCFIRNLFLKRTYAVNMYCVIFTYVGYSLELSYLHHACI